MGPVPFLRHVLRSPDALRVVGVLGALLTAWVVATAKARAPAALALIGPARVGSPGWVLAPGTTAVLGDARRVEVVAEGPFEVGFGFPPVGVARVAEGRAHLVAPPDRDGRGGRVIGQPVGTLIPAGAPVWLACGGVVALGTTVQTTGGVTGPDAPDDATAGDRAPPQPRDGCVSPRPAWVRALREVRFTAASLDGRSLDLSASDGLPWGLASLAVAAGLGQILGARALWPLLGAPLALVLPLPPMAVVAALSGACGVAAGRMRGWSLAGLGAAVAGVVVLEGPLPVAVPAEKSVADALAPLVTVDTYAGKVADIVRVAGPAVAASTPPLVVVLGGSSTNHGGSVSPTLWPARLGERLAGRATVISLAWGGATSWHARRALEELDLRPAVCLAYGGHNDTVASAPGRTIAEVEAGSTAPARPGLVPPVSLEEAAGNLSAVASRCGVLVAVQEHVRGNPWELAPYARMLAHLGQTLPNVRWRDGEQLLTDAHLHDRVHLTDEGHAALAEGLLPEVEAALAALPGGGP